MSNRVPAGWEAASFGDLCKFSGGSAFKEKYQGKGSGDYPFIKVSDMNIEGNQRFITKANHWIDQVTRLEAKVKLFPKPAVVFAKVGAALLLNRRRILTRETAIDNNMMAAIPFEDGHNFLYYALQEVDLGEIVQGGAVPSVNQAQMEDIPVLIPPLPEQQKIASILSSVDTVIETTRAQIDKLKDLKTGMMQELLTKGIGHTEFKDSSVGRIPKGWSIDKLINLSINGINNGVFNDPKNVGSGYRLINVVNMYRGFGIQLDTLKRLEIDEKEFARNRVEKGDVFFTRSSLKLEGIAYCNINLSDDDDITYDGHLMRVRPDQSRVLPKYLAYYCLSDFARVFFMQGAKHSTMTTIGQADIAPLPVLVPSMEEQIKICKVLDSIASKISTTEAKLISNQQVKKALMQDLLTGKVRVKVEATETA